MRNIGTSVAIAGAGILAAGLVSVPPEADAVRTEVRAVHLAAFAVAPGKLAGLNVSVGHQSRTVVVVPLTLARDAKAASPRASAQSFPSTVAPAIDGPQVNAAALAVSPDVISNPIVRSVIVAGLFFVVIPAFWIVIVATTAINVVLGVLGLPLLPNVPDPPFGAVALRESAAPAAVDSEPPSGNPVARQPDKADQPSDAFVAPKKRKADSSVDTVQGDSLRIDPADADSTITPKRRDRERRSTASDSVRMSADQTADNPPATEQHPLGHVGKKSKAGATDEEQKPGQDPTSKSSAPTK